MKRCILKSKNPRNQIFMEAIHELKLKSMRSRQEKLAFIYQKIMYSVQRYPMPILCEQQIEMLSGVGEKITCVLLSILHREYGKAMNQLTQNDILEEIIQNEEPPNITIDENSCPISILPNSKRIDIQDFKFDAQVQKQGLISKGKLPGKNSKGSKILMGLYQYQQNENKIYASKHELKEYARQNCGLDQLDWTAVDNLLKHNLITKTVLQNEVQFALTDQGSKLGEQFVLQSKRDPVNEKETPWEIILLIDNRERFQAANQRQVIYEKLRNIHSINCRLAQLPVGDFMWVAKKNNEEYVCNMIVERKTLADLASSIVDKRYNSQKYRLKECGIQNQFYLIENTTSNLCVPKQVLQTAIRNTQIRDGFSIQQTETLDESLQWLALVTQQMQPPRNLLKYSDFLYNNSQRSENLFNLWGSMLRGVNGVGLQSAKLIAKNWKTPAQFIETLSGTRHIDHMVKNISIKERSLPQFVQRQLEIIFLEETYPEQ